MTSVWGALAAMTALALTEPQTAAPRGAVTTLMPSLTEAPAVAQRVATAILTAPPMAAQRAVLAKLTSSLTELQPTASRGCTAPLTSSRTELQRAVVALFTPSLTEPQSVAQRIVTVTPAPSLLEPQTTAQQVVIALAGSDVRRAVVAAAGSSSAEVLAQAQRAFSEARYDSAEQLALQAAQPPQKGAALYLAGLARFRAGRPHEALEALDAAGRAEDPPERALWSFNRGACLYALEQFTEAEEAFGAAATEPTVARVAQVNAGFAALDGGSPTRAAQWAARAEPGATGRELELIQELRAALLSTPTTPQPAATAASTAAPCTDTAAPRAGASSPQDESVPNTSVPRAEPVSPLPTSPSPCADPHPAASPTPSEAASPSPTPLDAAARTPAAPTPSDAAYTLGLTAFDGGRFTEARAHFLRASSEDTASAGRARLMAAASAYRAGERMAARDDVTAALALPLDATDRETAHQYLDRLSTGLRARGAGLDFAAVASLGFDSNVAQGGIGPREGFGGPPALLVTGSPFAEVDLGLTGRLRLSDAAFLELSYGASQRAYSASAVEDYSLQVHRAVAALELDLASPLRLGVAVGGDLYFTGLSNFRGLQTSADGTAWLALDEGDRTTTRLDAAVARKVGLIDEFSYLTGNRLDATLSQELRLSPVSLTAWYRYRADLIGTLTLTTTLDEQVIPLAWTGHAAGASARWVLGPRWETGLDAGLEWRDYRSDSFVRLVTPEGDEIEANHRRRADTRFVLGARLSGQLTDALRLSARYDLLLNRSNIDTRLPDAPGTCGPPGLSCHRLDYANGNYAKHVLMLELSGSW